MSMPTIPDIKTEIDITFDDAVTLLLKSVAVVEDSISQLMDAEKEKIIFVLDECRRNGADARDIYAVNESVNKTIVNLSKLEMLLHYKLSSIEALVKKTPSEFDVNPSGPCTGMVLNRADRYYRNTATLNASVSLCQSAGNTILYHVGDDVRCLDMVVSADRMRIEGPCRMHPNSNKVYGQGRVTQVLGGDAHYRDVNFVLHVWNNEAWCDRFRMLILACENRAVIHRSGFVKVDNMTQQGVTEENIS